jgi:O-antigen/teichoic acid export membrane protein
MQEEPLNPASDTMDRQDIFGRAVKSGVWVLALRLVSGVLVFAKLVVLGRLLGPVYIGLLAFAMLVLAALQTFTQIGFSDALIQKKENIKDYLDTAWTLGIIRALFLVTILYFLAPYAAAFFNKPQAESIIKVISLTILLNSFCNIGVTYFRKELEFNKEFFYKMSGEFTDTVIAICAAIIYRNAWALVAGKLAGSCMKLAASYSIHRYRPRFRMDLEKAEELWKFGKHIMGSAILRFFILQGDDFVLAKMLGLRVLGLYRYAYRISNMMATEISDVIAQVAFSAYSKLQDDIDKLRAGYFKTVQVVSLAIFPIAGGIMVLAYELTDVVLGDEWLGMVGAMQILCFLGPLKCFQRAPAFRAIGRPDIIVKLSCIRFTVLVLTIYPLTKKFGMAGTSLSVLAANLSSQPVAFYCLQKFIGAKFRDVAKLLSFPIAATLIMMLCVFAVKSEFDTVGIVSLFFLVFLGVVIYSALIFLARSIDKKYDVIALARDVIKGLK